MRASRRSAPAPRLRAVIERAEAVPRRPRTSGEPQDEADHCGLCGLPVPAEHRHVLDLERSELHCACRACSLLFDHAAAGGRHYRLVPERRVALDGIRLDDLTWRALGIPVEMAFFVRDGHTRRVRAYYPSPAGVTHSQLPLEAWDELEAANPSLAAIEPDVEALLVNRTGSGASAFIVSIDQCFRLVAVVRRHWRGFTGGDEVWREVARFFDELRLAAETDT